MAERIQKLIAACGVTSRRNAEKLILEGRVLVNGHVCSLGEKADIQSDVITVDGHRLENKHDFTYIMLNKPVGYLTTLQDEYGRKNVSELVSCGTRVFPVGRLDKDSEGLLLMTDDGELANRLMHPSGEIRKTYLVHVRGFSSEGLRILCQPLVIDGYQIHPAEVTVLEIREKSAELQITIHEGRNRQIRKMCALADMQVMQLKRVAEGPLQLGNLRAGHWRQLTEAEISLLRTI